MKKFFKQAFMVAILSINMFMISNPTLVSAWGDNTAGGQGRPNYTKAQIDAGALGDKITFNSISDNTGLGQGEDGNEKYFVTTRKYNDTDTSHKWQAGSIDIEDGQEYVIRMYAHNQIAAENSYNTGFFCCYSLYQN